MYYQRHPYRHRQDKTHEQKRTYNGLTNMWKIFNFTNISCTWKPHWEREGLGICLPSTAHLTKKLVCIHPVRFKSFLLDHGLRGQSCLLCHTLNIIKCKTFVHLIYVNKKWCIICQGDDMEMILDRSIPAMIGQIVFFCSERSFFTISMHPQPQGKRGKVVRGNSGFMLWAPPAPGKKFFARFRPDDKGWRWNSSVCFSLSLFSALTFLCVTSQKRGSEKDLDVLGTPAKCQLYIIHLSNEIPFSFNKNVLGTYNEQASFELPIKIANPFLFCPFNEFILLKKWFYVFLCSF